MLRIAIIANDVQQCLKMEVMLLQFLNDKLICVFSDSDSWPKMCIDVIGKFFCTTVLGL